MKIVLINLILRNVNSKHKFKKIAINSLICLIPISYIAGNLILNLNVLIFIIVSLLLYGYKVFEEKFTNIDKIILVLFLYILLNSVWNNFFNPDTQDILKENFVLKKSFLFLGFFTIFHIKIFNKK